MIERSWCISEKSGEAGERSPASSVEGGAADTEVLGERSWIRRLRPADGPPLLPLGQGAFTPLALAGFLRQGDTLGLALPDDGPFKLGERPEEAEHEGGPRIGGLG